MLVTRRQFLGSAAAVVPVVATGQAPLEPRRTGQHPLQLGDDRDGLVYVPAKYDGSVAQPLLLMLHGAGNTSRSVQYTFATADEFGVIVLAPDSRDERTWDGVLRSWGPDVDFIGAALVQTLDRYNVDRRRVGVGGFSDGGSYALSFGITFGDQFGYVIAMSPGVMQPMAVRGKPRIFLSHGTKDPIMPIDDTSRKFAPKLKSLGYDVTYREYDGRHSPQPEIVHEAFEWFVG
jgi:phospholipase/carboxylesterase